MTENSTDLDLNSKVISIYEKIDNGELSTEDAITQINDILKKKRQAKLDCLKRLGL